MMTYVIVSSMHLLVIQLSLRLYVFCYYLSFLCIAKTGFLCTCRFAEENENNNAFFKPCNVLFESNKKYCSKIDKTNIV